MPDFETDADRLALLEELGDPVVYTPSGGSPVTIQAYIDLTAEVHEIINGVLVIGEQPEGEARTSDLTGTLEDEADTILFGGITYTIREPLPDNTGPDGTGGMTKFRLEGP